MKSNNGGKLISMVCLTVMISVLIALNGNGVEGSDLQYSGLPPPPSKPERFTSKAQLREYLVRQNFDKIKPSDRYSNFL